MSLLKTFLHHPQKIWIRKINFQVHLWVGIVLALYLIVIGVSGSILVLRIELGALTGANPWEARKAPEPRVDITAVVRNLTTRYPRFRIVSVTAPGKTNPTFIARLLGRTQIRVGVNPDTGQILGEAKRGPAWLDTVEKLHVSLFASRNGRIINGIGAAFLLAMCITGIINWWPGVRNWKRALNVDFGRSWIFASSFALTPMPPQQRGHVRRNRFGGYFFSTAANSSTQMVWSRSGPVEIMPMVAPDSFWMKLR